ncbi:unnamed protein product [Trichobilharzia szidati]|nr:unnamed protein product [Trichobilharzia szidati]
MQFKLNSLNSLISEEVMKRGPSYDFSQTPLQSPAVALKIPNRSDHSVAVINIISHCWFAEYKVTTIYDGDGKDTKGRFWRVTADRRTNKANR